MTRRIALVLSVGIFFSFCTWSVDAEDVHRSNYRLMLHLSDGSSVIGTTSLLSMPVNIKFADVNVSLSDLAIVHMNKTAGKSTFKLTNGDRLTGTLKLDRFSLRTLIGEVSVAATHVTRIFVLSDDDSGTLSSMGRKFFVHRMGQARRDVMKENGGTQEGDEAVLKALRWLKVNQLPDGSWPGDVREGGPQRNASARAAYTGMCLLAFFGHGETGRSPEFGDAVEKGIAFLLKDQRADGRFRSRDGHDYAHSIATLALCEAYALTADDDIRAAAQKAVRPIMNGQNASGGWNYNLKPCSRDDTSYMGWCAQAVKAAYSAGVFEDDEVLQRVMKNAIQGFKKNAHPEGGFGYTGPGQGGLTGVGVACMWFLGGEKETERRKGTAWLTKTVPPTWRLTPENPVARSPVYFWYYINQAVFFEGGDVWKKWNKGFLTELVMNQKKGRTAETGYWESPAEREHTAGNVQDTALCTLMLEVYYRMLREHL